MHFQVKMSESGGNHIFSDKDKTKKVTYRLKAITG